MINILIKMIMSMGIHKAVQLLLKLAHVIVKKTKTEKDDIVVQTLIEVWDQLQGIIPNNVLKLKRQGLK